MFYGNHIIYPINFSYKSHGSKVEKKLINLFYNLEKKDHKNETDLMIDLLRFRYGLYVPEDLIQVAKDEILDPNYYKMSKKKKVQAGIKTAYKIDFWRLRMNQRRNWAFYGLSFGDYVEKRVMKEERLGPKTQITFERLANFSKCIITFTASRLRIHHWYWYEWTTYSRTRSSTSFILLSG